MTFKSDIDMPEVDKRDGDIMKLELMIGNTRTFKKILGAFMRQALTKQLSSYKKAIKELEDKLELEIHKSSTYFNEKLNLMKQNKKAITDTLKEKQFTKRELVMLKGGLDRISNIGMDCNDAKELYDLKQKVLKKQNKQ